MSVTETISVIQNDLENLRCDKTQQFPVAAAEGDYVRQGDVYITLRSQIPSDCSESDHGLQLAPGTTKGSRHLLDSGEGVTFYVRQEPTVLQGPFLRLDCERVLKHPEHGDWKLPPGLYEITYQRVHADELRRVLD